MDYIILKVMVYYEILIYVAKENVLYSRQQGTFVDIGTLAIKLGVEPKELLYLVELNITARTALRDLKENEFGKPIKAIDIKAVNNMFSVLVDNIDYSKVSNVKQEIKQITRTMEGGD